MRVLYVTSVHGEEFPSPMEELAAIDASLDVHRAAGAAAALVELRARTGYSAVFLSPRLPQNESLALVAALRRDRIPVAIVAIITESQRQFLAPALMAGADDVLVKSESGLVKPERTLARVRASRHQAPPADQARLQVLYAGQDDLAWDLLFDMPFARAERVDASADGACPVTMPQDPATVADVVIVDEQRGDGHVLQVVKWLKTHAPDVRVVLLTPATGYDVAAPALELGVDQVISKAGTYRRRLAATLHRMYLDVTRPQAAVSDAARTESTTGPTADTAWVAGTGPRPASELDAMAHERAVAAEAAIRDLTAQVDELRRQLDRTTQTSEELNEALGFERAMRDRDREELSGVRHSLHDERERRLTLERTLAETEARAAAERASAERAAAERASVERAAAERAAAERAAAERAAAERAAVEHAARQSRLLGDAPFGWATLTLDGSLIACNATFAHLFGFDSETAARASGAPFAGLPDHAHLVEQLRAGTPVSRVDCVLHRADGRPFRALTSAVFSAGVDGEAASIDRLIIDVDDRTRLDEQLRLARRLESAGRLAAEMSPELDAALSALDDPLAPIADRRRASLLVRQLLAFSRHQAQPAGLLSLADAARRAEPRLRQIAGDLASIEMRLADVGSIAASEDDAEQLFAALTFAAAGSLPFGGQITIETRPVRSGFDERIELAVSATGYGVQPPAISSSLARLVLRCGGTVQTVDDPGRRATLHVSLPC